EFTQPTPRERVAVLVRHIHDAVALDGEPGGVIASRKVMAAYLKRMPNARGLRAALMQSTTLTMVSELCDVYLEDIGALADVPCAQEVTLEEFASEC
ncbi:MAG TPA: hypothetical protein VFH88_06760, partial [Candidatus Krumholzibacteria bacterium]|nr:hypothetical protein [Candidatus Krumholzibacteria bacterium]